MPLKVTTLQGVKKQKQKQKQMCTSHTVVSLRPALLGSMKELLIWKCISFWKLTVRYVFQDKRGFQESMRVTLAVTHYIGDMEPEVATSCSQAGTPVEQ